MWAAGPEPYWRQCWVATFRSAAAEETFEAGDAYFVPPGHTPNLYAGTEIVEFSPTDALSQTMEAVGKNLRAAGIEV